VISKSFAVMGVLTFLSAGAHAGSAPKEFYGKSIIITWTEARSQRELGEANFRDRLVPLSERIYISTKGQWFVRSAAGSDPGHDYVGTSVTTASGGRQQVQFNGRTITMTTGGSSGGMARRFIIQFNESFSTCDVHVIFAKRTGSGVVLGHNLVTGAAEREIRSGTVTSTSCSVRDGNVFAQ
jgi:hypothetical protein